MRGREREGADWSRLAAVLCNLGALPCVLVFVFTHEDERCALNRTHTNTKAAAAAAAAAASAEAATSTLSESREHNQNTTQAQLKKCAKRCCFSCLFVFLFVVLDWRNVWQMMSEWVTRLALCEWVAECFSSVNEPFPHGSISHQHTHTHRILNKRRKRKQKQNRKESSLPRSLFAFTSLQWNSLKRTGRATLFRCNWARRQIFNYARMCVVIVEKGFKVGFRRVLRGL